MELMLLKEPFKPEEIEWRVQSAGVDKNGRPWARVLAYVQSRAIMDRLDEVVGPDAWKDEYLPGPAGGVVCGISILVGDRWVTKWDGAENTEFESIKGGLSGAFKRAAVKWGIGRYLYALDADFAVIYPPNSKTARYYHPRKVRDGNEVNPAFKWEPPVLPDWAVPDGTKQRKAPLPGKDEQEEQNLIAIKEALYQKSRKMYADKLIDGERGKAFKARLDEASNKSQTDALWKVLDLVEAAGHVGNQKKLPVNEAKTWQDDFIENVVDEESAEKYFDLFSRRLERKEAQSA